MENINIVSEYLKNYNKIYKNRKSIKIVKIWIPYRIWILKKIKTILEGSVNVLDFGCNIESDFYNRCKKFNIKHYFGYDLDIDTVEWLNKNVSFVDFWNTDKTFDLVNISQVYEHLNITDRMNLIKRCHAILNKGGYLLVDFPFTENFNFIFFNKDITHKPVSSTDDPLLIKSLGFEFDFVYLAGMKYKNVLLNIFSLLLFGSYQQTLQIIAKKQS